MLQKRQAVKRLYCAKEKIEHTNARDVKESKTIVYLYISSFERICYLAFSNSMLSLFQ